MTPLQILLALLAEAPALIADGESVAQEFTSAPDGAAKAQAVVNGINHVAATVLPVLAPKAT